MTESSIFLALLEIDDPSERVAYLDRACAGDAALRAQVEQLLKAHQEPGRFMDRPAAALVGPPEEPSVSERPGTLIGPYKLLEQIGEGGFGVVFMAEQQQPVRRKVALKVLKPGMDSKPVVARFEAERQALALMDHPHIAHVLDAGATDAGRPYFVMELIRGIPITAFCDDNRLTPRERLELFLTVCQAVQHAHQKGIIHRDLKPSNVLVTLLDGTPLVKVIDFGIAKALGQERLTEKTLFTGFAQMIGTPLYMSPEQAEMSGRDVDTRTDIYALGVLLYELLTGTTPFDKERLKEASYDEIRRIIREEEPAKPSTRISTLGQAATTVSANRRSEPKRLSQLFRRELDWIVMKALEKDRNRRYDTASSFAADVQRYLDAEPVQACPPRLVQKAVKWARRHRTTVSAAAVVLLLAFAGLTASTWLIWQQQRQTKIALAEARSNALKAEQNRDRAYKILDEIYVKVAEKRMPREKEVTPEDRQLLESILSWYQEIANQDSNDPKVRLETAQAYRRVGGVLQRLRQTEQARAAYEQALAVSADLVAEFPDDPDYRYDLVRSYSTLGDIFLGFPDGRLPDFERLYAEALRLLEQLVAGDATNLDYLHDLGLTYFRLGYMRLYRLGGPLDKAEGPVRRALEIRSQLVAEKPTEFLYRQELGMSLGACANLLLRRCKYQEAEEVVHRELELCQKLVDDFPAEAEVRANLADAYRDQAVLRECTGKFQEEVDAFRQALTIRKKLAEEFPSWYLAQFNVAKYNRNLGDALRDTGALDEAMAAYEESIAGFKEIIRRRPKDALAYWCLGQVLARAHHSNEALAAWEKAVRWGAENADVVEGVAWLLSTTSDLPAEDPQKAVQLAQKAVNLAPQSGDSWNVLGVTYYRAGQWLDAVDALQKGMQLHSGATCCNWWGTGIDWLFLAMAYWQLGDAQNAHHWYEQAVAWVDQNKPHDGQLRSIRTEAAALLGVEEVPPNK